MVEFSAAYSDARNNAGRVVERKQSETTRQTWLDEGVSEGRCLRAFTSVYETNMDDAVQEPEKKNCTFLFKRRKIRSNATRKRKGADGSDGESSLISVI